MGGVGSKRVATVVGWFGGVGSKRAATVLGWFGEWVARGQQRWWVGWGSG